MYIFYSFYSFFVVRVSSAPYGIPSRGRSAGTMKLGLLIDLDSHKPVTVETT